MAVKVRLTRVGSKKNPVWRVVVADGRSPRDGRFIELIGHYNPQTQPSRIEIDRERLRHWLDRGAEPSNTVRKLMRAENTGFEIPQAERSAPVAATRPAADEAAEPVEAPTEGEAAPPATAEAEAEAPASEAEAGEADADAAGDAGEDKGDVDVDAGGDENA